MRYAAFMDIGLNDPEDYDALHRILDMIDDIDRRQNGFMSDPAVLWNSDCDLADLVAALPDPPVDIRLTVGAGLTAAHNCLWQVSKFITESIATTSVALLTLARTALLGASRVVFMLGPDAPDERERNAAIVLRQETASLMRLYDDAEHFTSLTALVPPPDVIAGQRARAVTVNRSSKRLGEAKTLQAVARVVGKLLADSGYDRTALPAHGEHLAWTFNTYSGVAHGFGWPRLVPGTDSAPGHFLSDLYLVTSTTQLAFEVAQQRTSVHGA